MHHTCGLDSKAQTYNCLFTSKVDIVDQHHSHRRIQVLHQILDLILGFTRNVAVDVSCSLIGFVKVDIDGLTRVVFLNIFQERFHRIKTSAHGDNITNIKLLFLLAVTKHVEKMLISFIDLRLAHATVAQTVKKLALGFTTGSYREHGQGGRDAQW